VSLYDWAEYAMSEDKPKRSTCPDCRLLTLLTYPDGLVRCQNFSCSRYTEPPKVQPPTSVPE
jgi:hypothetical protein